MSNFFNVDKSHFLNLIKKSSLKANFTILFGLTLVISSFAKPAHAVFPFSGTLYPGQNVCVRIDNSDTDFALNLNRANYNWVTRPSFTNQAPPQPNYTNGNPIAYLAVSSYHLGYWVSWWQRPKYVNIVNQTSNVVFTGAIWSSRGNAVNPGACYTRDSRVIYNYLIRS